MLSYVHGTSLEPLSGQTVGQVFDQASERYGDRTAVVSLHQDARLSWTELRRRVDDIASALLILGLEPGDRIGLLAPNSIEWVIAQFATAKAGLILVNLNPAYRTPELEYALRHVGCRALITAHSFKSSRYVEMLRQIAPELERDLPGQLNTSSLPDLRTVILLGESQLPAFVSWADLEALGNRMSRQHLDELGVRLQFDQPVNIQFTSGTTGSPKATTLSHHTIVNNARFTGQAMELGEADRLCIPVPLYHCFGMVLGTLTAVAHGAQMVFPSAGFDAGAVLEAIARERCTAVHGVPTMFIAELEHPSFPACDTSSLRTGIMAGAPCPEELMRRVMSELGLRQITIAYGMTETGPVSFQTSVHDSIERRVTTVGRVLPHTEVKIIDEGGLVVPRGTSGELLTRGYCVMSGYWEDPERTAEAIDRAGWMHSGDLAVLDEDDYCQIVGRIKDMLIRGGENIFPREIEELLYTHPKVEEVEVFGVLDERYGEEICAWIKLRPGEEAAETEIRDFCRERIAHFKIPRHIRFVKAFPMTVTGKVQKFKMRELMTRELEVKSSAAVEGELIAT